jgi:hypothetical protein
MCLWSVAAGGLFFFVLFEVGPSRQLVSCATVRRWREEVSKKKKARVANNDGRIYFCAGKGFEMAN